MFFVLSKTLNYFSTPVFLVCASLMFSVIVKSKLKRIFFWTGFGLLLFFSNGFIANFVMHTWELSTTPYNQMQKYKLAIVLTGSTIPGLSPSDRVYFGRGADRVTHTVQLYKLGLVEKIFVSGGSGRLQPIGEREAEEYKKAMIIMGVPSEVIITESETRNTHESAVEVKKIIDRLGYRSEDCLLVTSAFYMRRSLACYRKVGLNPDYFTTDFYSEPPKFHLDSLLVPKVEAMDIWTKLIREWVGMIAYKFAGYI
jgi:uncharacterized SAM-binding protein YcdF (DUF218 family)